MNYGEIKEFDVANGEGVRVTLFVSGCTNHCKGCFQPQTWDFTYGRRFDGAAEKKILDFLDFPYADGVTFLGGEPMEPDNQRELVKLARKIRETHPDKTIWCFTGFVYDRDLIPGGKRYIEVTDDLLDVTGSADKLGKSTGKDLEQNKMTWVALRGVEGTAADARKEIELAQKALEGMPGDTARFAAFADSLLGRAQ